MKLSKSFAVAAFAYSAIFAATAHAQGTNDSGVRLEFSENPGDSPGVDDGYHRLGTFFPLFEDNGSIVFVDGHSNLNYASGGWSANLGLGYREDVNGGVVVGGNAYYNFREVSNGPRNNNSFHTVGFGVEALMSDWAVRSNAYVAASGRRSNGRTAVAGYIPQVGGSAGVSNIGLAISENFDAALSGFDLNVSRKIPAASSEVGVGTYFLAANGGPDTWGVNGTVETSLTSNVAANVSVSHDDLFDTTVYGGISVYIGGPNTEVAARSSNVGSRLWSRVQRRHVAPVANYTTTASVRATDPNTGDLITVRQVNTGDDIQGAPNLLEDDAEFIDIILAAPGSVFTPAGSIALNGNQRLLSAQLLHGVDTTEFGLIALPESGLGGTASMITAPVGSNAVTLANGNEVSGFSIVAAAGESGIFGSNVTEFDINRNVLDGATNGGVFGMEILSGGINVAGLIESNTVSGFTDDGMRVEGIDIAVNFLSNNSSNNTDDGIDVRGSGNFSGLVDDNTLSNNDDGIFLTSDTNSGTVTNNTANGNRDDGIDITNRFGRGHFNGLVMDNTTSNNGVDGLAFRLQTISGRIIDNTANNNGRTGILTAADNVPAGSRLDMTGSTTHRNGDDGISVVFDGTLDSEVLVDDNEAFGNTDDGIAIVSNGTGDIRGNVTNNVTLVNGNRGVFARSNDAASNILMNVTDNRSDRNGQEGIRLHSANDVNALVSRNTVDGNGFSGVAVRADNNVTGRVDQNTASGSGGSGVFVNADNDASGAGDVTADITNNTSNNNTRNGVWAIGVNINSQITGNTTNNNNNSAGTDDGGLVAEATGNITGLIDNNTSHGNTTNGIAVLADFDNDNVGDATATVSNNRTGVAGNGNGVTGIFIRGASVNSRVFTNTANNNVLDGISLQSNGNIAGLIDVNTANGNRHGIFIAADDDTNGVGDVTATIAVNTTGIMGSGNSDIGLFIMGANINSQIFRNTANSNGVDGINLDTPGDISGLLEDNVAGIAGGGNGRMGVLVQGRNLTPNVFSNQADNNVSNGFHFTLTGNSSSNFNNNMASNNGGFGFDTFATGTVTGTRSPNTSTGNTGGAFTGNIAQP